MYKQTLSIIAVLSAVQLSGCAQPTEPENMAVNAAQGVAVSEKSPYFKNVAVKAVSGGSETNPMLAASISDADFKIALDKSLKQANLGSEGDARYQLTAHIKHVDTPVFAANMNIKMSVAYHLEDKKTGAPVFSQTLDSVGRATVGDAFVAVERLRLAKEDAAKKNITMLLQHFNKM